MSLLVTGSLGIDTVETPHGRADNVLGGSAVYFALAASVYTPVRMVGVVGDDFDMALLDPLARRNIDLSAVEVRRGSRTFRWHGRYREEDINLRDTVRVDLNVLAEHGPEIPEDFVDSRYVFLANTHPGLQLALASRMAAADLLVCDTMDLWINTARDALLDVLATVQGVVLNDVEARLLTGESNLVVAGRKVLEFGPQFVVVKKGEHGGVLVSRDDLFLIPAFPLAQAVDPTGAGDSFAGGMLGYLAACGRHDVDTLRAAAVRGAVIASFVLESFSIDALARVTLGDVDRRLAELRERTRFE